MSTVSSQLRAVNRYRFLHEKVEAVLRGAAALGGCSVNATLSSIEEIAPRSRRDWPRAHALSHRGCRPPFFFFIESRVLSPAAAAETLL